MKNILPSLLFSFFSVIVLAQSPSIGGTTIVPQAPTTGDDILIITEVTTSNYGNKVSSSQHVSTNPAVVTLKSCYYNGLLTAQRTYIDTFAIGKIAAGNYQVRFTAQMTPSNNICIPHDSNVVVVNMTVISPTGTEAHRRTALSIYPNPAAGMLYLKSEINIVAVRIYSATGRFLGEQFPDRSGAIDVAALPAGLYIVRLKTDSGERSATFIKGAAD